MDSGDSFCQGKIFVAWRGGVNYYGVWGRLATHKNFEQAGEYFNAPSKECKRCIKQFFFSYNIPILPVFGIFFPCQPMTDQHGFILMLNASLQWEIFYKIIATTIISNIFYKKLSISLSRKKDKKSIKLNSFLYTEKIKLIPNQTGV